MDFSDIVLDELESKDDTIIQLDESIAFFTPFLAFASMKRSAFDRFNKAGKFFKRLKKIPAKLKAKAALGGEEAKATLGLTAGKGKGATIYRPTTEQKRVMVEVYRKYGKDIAVDIRRFRNKILSRYQLAKRLIKQSSTVSSKEALGMTHEQYKSALESGRKKIEARGGHFKGVSLNRQKMEQLNDRIDALNHLKNDFERGGVPKYSLANKVYRTFDAGDEDLEGFSREELRTAYDNIVGSQADLKAEYEKLRKKGNLSSEDFKKASELLRRSREARSGRLTGDLKRQQDRKPDLTKESAFKREGKFNVALGRYFLSREIWNQLTKGGKLNTYRKTYLSIISKMLDRARARKTGETAGAVRGKKSVEFSSREAKIWKTRPTAKPFSGNLDDYYQEIQDSDFTDQPTRIPRTPEMRKFIRDMENDIKRETRKIKAKIDTEDWEKLRKFRLVNNFISVRELENPKTLFKSREELKKEEGEAEPEKEYLSKTEFFRRIKEIATIEYDTIHELENAKKEAKELAQKMKNQEDEEAVEDYRDILRQIEKRRSTAPQKLVGRETEGGGIIDIDNIQKSLEKIMRTDYDSVDAIKQDRMRVGKMIDQYKKTDSEAEKNLAEIKFLIDKVDRKLITSAK